MGEPQQIPRRTFLVGSAAVVGAAAWVPPVVESFTAKAAAASAPPKCTIPSSIASNFNGTAIPGASYIWFSAVVQLTGTTPPAPVSLTFNDQSIVFTAGVVPYTIDPPDSTVVFGTTSQATPSFNGSWTVLAPLAGTPSTFLAGVLFQVPAGGFAGGISPVTWSGTFGLPSGVKLNWAWAAAVYLPTTTPTAPGSLQVVAYNGADGGLQPGTPVALEAYLGAGGARGGSGNNYTGSLSGTTSASCS